MELPTSSIEQRVEEESFANNPSSQRRATISNEIRECFLRFIRTSPDVSISSAAKTFGLPVSTAHTMLKRNEIVGDPGVTPGQSRRGGPHNRKIKSEVEDSLSRYIDERPDITLTQLKFRILNDHNVDVSKETISKALARLGFTVKILRVVPVSRNSERVIKESGLCNYVYERSTS